MTKTKWELLGVFWIKEKTTTKVLSLVAFLLYSRDAFYFESAKLSDFLFLFLNTFWYLCFNSWWEKACCGQTERRQGSILLPCAEHKNNIMHCYQQADTSELPPSIWFGAWASAAHISSYTADDTARIDPLPEFCLLMIGQRTFQFAALLYILTFMFIIFHIYITTPVMNRHPAGSWYGKLDILLFMKSTVFISHFHSWPPLDLAVNVLKTDSALLDSWIKAMVLIMTLLALVCGQALAAQSTELSPLHEVSWECCVTAQSDLAK